MFSEKKSQIYNYFTTFESHDMILAGVICTPVVFSYDAYAKWENLYCFCNALILYYEYNDN